MNRSNLIIFLLFLPNSLAQDEFLPDEECESMNSEALREKIREGLCKPIQFGREEASTTTTQKPKRKLISAHTKRRLMKIIYFGNQRYLNVTLNTKKKESIQLLEVVEGTFLELKCNTNNTLANET
uniref:Uncharacterized protein n=2 Tax=Bursaphelenchus xylophilus TaxID=6326 RepID=A0A1I7SJS6_BURXY